MLAFFRKTADVRKQREKTDKENIQMLSAFQGVEPRRTGHSLGFVSMRLSADCCYVGAQKGLYWGVVLDILECIYLGNLHAYQL